MGGTANVASLGVPLVYYSTDYVFDGRKREPYFESDGPNPQSAYGRSKLHGEAAAGDEAWIIRSSWLFGPTGHNFVRTMLRLGVERDEVAVVDDQRGSPTYVGHLAAATRDVLQLSYGIYHVAAGGECTWADFAEAIFAEAGLECRVRRISTAELRRPAPRPAYSVLRSEKARRSSRTGATACARAWPRSARSPGTNRPPMARYRFLTTWILDAQPEPVWDAIYAIERWPGWWRGVRSVEQVEHGNGDGVGSLYRHEWRSVIPYPVRFETRITQIERPHLIEAEADGELAGTGRWRFVADRETAVTYEWDVRTTRGLDEPARAGCAPDLPLEPQRRHASGRGGAGRATRCQPARRDIAWCRCACWSPAGRASSAPTSSQRSWPPATRSACSTS